MICTPRRDNVPLPCYMFRSIGTLGTYNQIEIGRREKRSAISLRVTRAILIYLRLCSMKRSRRCLLASWVASRLLRGCFFPLIHRSRSFSLSLSFLFILSRQHDVTYSNGITTPGYIPGCRFRVFNRGFNYF